MTINEEGKPYKIIIFFANGSKMTAYFPPYSRKECLKGQNEVRTQFSRKVEESAHTTKVAASINLIVTASNPPGF